MRDTTKDRCYGDRRRGRGEQPSSLKLALESCLLSVSDTHRLPLLLSSPAAASPPTEQLPLVLGSCPPEPPEHLGRQSNKQHAGGKRILEPTHKEVRARELCVCVSSFFTISSMLFVCMEAP